MYLRDRIDQDAQWLARRARQAEAWPVRESYRMMHRVATDLEQMAVALIDAITHCNDMLGEPVISGEVPMLRDTIHLSARVEAMVAQLEDTVRTLERLSGRPEHRMDVPQSQPEGIVSGDGSSERYDQPARAVVRRPLRSIAPALDV